MIDHTGPTANPYLYTGQQLDELIGLYNLRARNYDPTLGRFLSRDVAAINFNNPFELNRYGYVANNPLSYVDRLQTRFRLLACRAVSWRGRLRQ